MFVTLMCAVMLASSIPVHAVSNTTINFLLMVASESSVNVSTVVSAVNQTLKEINMDMKYRISDDKVECTGFQLALYLLALHQLQCNATRALQFFYNEVEEHCPSTVPAVAIVGCGCSSATEEVARISHFWNVPVVSKYSVNTV